MDETKEDIHWECNEAIEGLKEQVSERDELIGEMKEVMDEIYSLVKKY